MAREDWSRLDRRDRIDRRKAVIRALWPEPSVSVEAIGTRLGVKPCTVSTTAKRLGLPPRRQKGLDK